MLKHSSRSESETSPGTPDRWLLLSLVSMNYFALYVHRNLINYFQPPLQADLALDQFQLGLLRWGFVLPYCLAQLWVGYLGDRYRRRTVLLVSLIASTVSLGLMGLAQSFEGLLALRILLALAQSPSVPAIASVIADCFTPRTRSTAVGIYLVSYNFSLVVGRQGGLEDPHLFFRGARPGGGWLAYVVLSVHRCGRSGRSGSLAPVQGASEDRSRG